MKNIFVISMLLLSTSLFSSSKIVKAGGHKCNGYNKHDLRRYVGNRSVKEKMKRALDVANKKCDKSAVHYKVYSVFPTKNKSS